MESTVIQFRIDKKTKNEASKIYNELGIDLSTALRTFLRRSIKENGYPFDMKIKRKYDEDAIKALSSIQAEAKINGTSNMTLDEINKEINAARRDRKK